jgi:hypothetical protein
MSTLSPASPSPDEGKGAADLTPSGETSPQSIWGEFLGAIALRAGTELGVRSVVSGIQRGRGWGERAKVTGSLWISRHCASLNAVSAWRDTLTARRVLERNPAREWQFLFYRGGEGAAGRGLLHAAAAAASTNSI